MKTQRWPIISQTLLLPLNGVGIFLSWTLLQTRWAIQTGKQFSPAFCDAKASSGCRLAALSPYSEVFGHIPVSALALAFFTVTFLTEIHRLFRKRGSEDQHLVRSAFMLQILACLASVFYLWIMFHVIGQFCSGCLGIHLVNGTLLGLQWIRVKKSVNRVDDRKVIAALLVSFLLIALIAGAWVFGTEHFTQQNSKRYYFTKEVFTAPLDPHYRAHFGNRGEELHFIMAVDLACPYCEEMFKNFTEALQASGKQASVDLILFPMHQKCNPYAGLEEPGACTAAEIAICRAQENRFDEFVHQAIERPANLISGVSGAVALAETDAPSRPALEECVASPKTRDELKRLLEITQGDRTRSPVDAVPTIWFKGVRITGALSPQEWVRFFEKSSLPLSDEEL
ncbi:MAG: thioredoxin domain-containing protein [Methylotenera sp.]|nr:thioredoxin domain-containing protein [Oligoflexia bacterium]